MVLIITIYLLFIQVRVIMNIMVKEKIINEGDFDIFELKTLGSFQSHVGIAILNDFKADIVVKNVTNKSGFLAGIMRRYSKIIKNSDTMLDVQSPEKIKTDGSVTAKHVLLAEYDDDDVDVEVVGLEYFSNYSIIICRFASTV